MALFRNMFQKVETINARTDLVFTYFIDALVMISIKSRNFSYWNKKEILTFKIFGSVFET